MFKFIMILISLLMTVFGGLFLTTLSVDANLNTIKENCNYDKLSHDKQIEFDKYVKRATNISFISFIFGICLFIASLFL